MKISLNWLKEFVPIDTNAEILADTLTMLGLEIERMSSFNIGQWTKNLVVGEVCSCENVPDTDKLKLTSVKVSDTSFLQIICGAPNIKTGQKVVVAPPNTTIFPYKSKPMKIKSMQIKKTLSQGMICSEMEIGLGTQHQQIMVLSPDATIGSSIAEVMGLEDDCVFEVAITPNRADAISHYGIAMDLHAFDKRPLCFPSVKFNPDYLGEKIDIEIEDDSCLRYTGVNIEKVKIASSPIWLKKRLLSIGLEPINNIVDITNYLLYGFGQALHAFDRDKIIGKKVIIKKAEKNTTIITLDKKERNLTGEELMIYNQKEPMCIAGVMGGLTSSISNQTKNIFLECAYFQANSIQKTSKKHQIITGASYLYAHGADINRIPFAIKYATSLIKELCGGKISSSVEDIYPKRQKDKEIKLHFKEIKRVLGIALTRKKVRTILEGLEIEIIKEEKAYFEIKIPFYRVDVEREIDVIEEILRIYGYNHFEFSESITSYYQKESDILKNKERKEKIIEFLISNEMYQIQSNSIIDAAKSIPIEDDKKIIMLENPLSEDINALRNSMIPSFLEVMLRNMNRKQKYVKIFEWGKIYYQKDKDFKEEEVLSIGMTGISGEDYWEKENKKIDFFELMMCLDNIFALFGFYRSDFSLIKSKNSLFDYGIDFLYEKKYIASVGKLKEEVCNQYQLVEEIFFAFIDPLLLFKVSKNNCYFTYQKLIKFPQVTRDVSFVMDKEISYEEIKKIAVMTEYKILKKITIFDVYQGDGIGKDKKSYSIRFTLQDDKKTLKQKKINKIMEMIIERYAENKIFIRK